MAQLGEQQTGRLAQAAGRLLRSGRLVIGAITPKKEGGKQVIGAITPKKEGGKQTSRSPITPPSPGQASVADELTSGFPNSPLSPGQADFGAVWQPSCTRGRRRADARGVGRASFA